MKIAVTGARGFVGRHVLYELALRGVQIVAIERKGVVRERPAIENVQWIPIDIANPPADCFLALERPDVLLHLAWDGLPNYRSLYHFETELPRQYGFLSNAVRGGLPALVIAGTCLEYGLQSGALSPRLQTRPTTPYGFAKDTLRRELQFLKAAQPFQLTWARLYYMYGDDQPATSLYPMLKAAVAAGRTDFPMSGGEQLRDYLPVCEIARRLADLAACPADRGLLNLCSGRPVSVRRLVEGWIEQNGWTIRPRYGELPYADYEPMAFWGEPEA
ncbi:NAD-dependent epimerase/dehydratase family protein [Bradyrhizobium sp. GCM10028915]|uniref:NAD-dependent epimerase/dehydratase family protein n=1 Tax=Bradyrhizobium sp. GCM10028915 TaxID=3273385 RepID=UPI0036243DA0